MDGSGTRRERGLDDLIMLAEKRVEFFGSLNLSALKAAGDEVLRRYDQFEPLSDADEKTIVEYLRTLKALVQKVEV